MAFSLVASERAQGLTATTSAIDTTGADLIVLSIVCQDIWDGTPTDNQANTWTEVTNSYTQTNVRVRTFYCSQPTTNASHTFTLPQDSEFQDGTGVIFATAWSGAADALPFDKINGANNFDTVIDAGNITPAEDNELVISVMGINGAGTPISVDSAMTKLYEEDFDSGVAYGGAVAYIIQNSANAINPSWTRTNSNGNAAMVVSFKAGAPSSIAVENSEDFGDAAGAGSEDQYYNTHTLSGFDCSQGGDTALLLGFYCRSLAADLDYINADGVAMTSIAQIETTDVVGVEPHIRVMNNASFDVVVQLVTGQFRLVGMSAIALSNVNQSAPTTGVPVSTTGSGTAATVSYTGTVGNELFVFVNTQNSRTLTPSAGLTQISNFDHNDASNFGMCFAGHITADGTAQTVGATLDTTDNYAVIVVEIAKSGSTPVVVTGFVPSMQII